MADLQVDVEAALPEGAEEARICVEGVGFREEGAGNGRLAMTGLPAEQPAVVTVAILDAEGGLLGASKAVTLDGNTPYQTTDFGDATEICAPTGSLAPEGSASWLLAIRFTESGW